MHVPVSGVFSHREGDMDVRAGTTQGVMAKLMQATQGVMAKLV